MTYAYDWSDQYNTGIEIIDNQHKRLFQYLREIDSAMKEHDDARMEVMVRSLLEYTVSHCAFEESLMERAHYPYFEPHKHGHDLFRQRAAAYVRRLEEGEERYHLAREVRSEMSLWLTGHIGSDDQDYVPYVMASLNNAQGRGIIQRVLSHIFA